MKEETIVGKMQYQRDSWATWCQVCLFGFSAVIILSERAALMYCFVHYLWMGRMLWAWLTFGLALPGTAVQVLSLKWYRADGDRLKPLLVFIHVLHLGIFKRLWGCVRSLWRPQGSEARLGVAVMQQADVSALRLLEALLLTLPQTLLQTYILFTTDAGLVSAVCLCSGLCLLSLSWALVLYSRACSLIRPGHLPMPPAALLCQLIWRVSMLGARVASLVFFSRVFSWWVYAVVGFHWVTATFWLVSQQTDICSSARRWRLFNCILGAVHVFFYLNVRDSPSRFRMAGFYLIMLLENAALLLSASDFFGEPTWDSMSIPTAVLCAFLMGTISMVLYYRFLHPKSTEIFQSLRLSQLGADSLERGSSYSLGEKTVPEPSVHRHGTFSITGVAPSWVEHSELGAAARSSVARGHHHWLLIRLALKTGDLDKLNLAYGAGGVAALLDAEELPPCQADPPASGSAPEHGDQPPSGEREDLRMISGVSLLPDDDGESGAEAEESAPDSSSASEFRRESPEGRSALVDTPAPGRCPAASSTTVYYSADTHSPSSASNACSDREAHSENAGQLSPISSGREFHWATRDVLNRAPCYTSTPKPQELNPEEKPCPRPGGARRQLVHFR